MEKPPVLAGTSVRGWDIYGGAFMGVVCVNALVMNDQPLWHWLVPAAALTVWYALVGRRAIVRRERAWVMTFSVGAVLLFAAGAWLDPWLAPLQGALIPVLWWLVWPNRRSGAVWTVTVALVSSLALGMFKLLDRDTPDDVWSVAKTVVYVVIVPVGVCVVGILAGWWANDLLRWGQERVDLVDDLRATESQRIALEREAAASEERLHLSQEIHDTIAQDVAGLRLLVERARRQVDMAAERVDVADALEPVSHTLGMISTGVDAVLVETRELITSTAPVPDGSSFKEAVERIGNRFAQETDIVVDMDVVDTRLPRESEVVFIRCLQEGLSNVRRHAHATRVWISIATVAGGAVMTLTDNGVGLEPGAASGFGLPGMAERVRQAGGNFSVESPGPHLGVIVRVRMPVRPAMTVADGQSAAAPIASNRGEGAP